MIFGMSFGDLCVKILQLYILVYILYAWVGKIRAIVRRRAETKRKRAEGILLWCLFFSALLLACACLFGFLRWSV